MRTLRYGSKGKVVEELQELLNTRLNPSPALPKSGHFRRRTLKALRRFQDLAGLAIDGIAGPLTWKTLRSGIPVSAAKAQAPAKPSVSDSVTAPSANGAEAAWIKIAEAEIGQAEKKGKQHNPRIIEYHATTTYGAKTDETAWCASFVNWVLKQAGIKGTNSAGAASWATWGDALTVGRKGAITVIYNASMKNTGLSVTGNHVGFLVEETKTHYHLLGGNQSDQVKESKFPKASWTLKGMRWPSGK